MWVACRNLLNGELAEADCEVACTACGRCAADAPAGLIQIVNNLAVVDYSRNRQATHGADPALSHRGHRLDRRKAGPVKGLDAKKITRKSPLPVEQADLPVLAVGHHSGREGAD